MSADYDVVVLGGGPAGYPAAIRAAQLGARVCLIEREKLGGVCLNWGCIPTKTLHAAAHLLERSSAAGETGLSGNLKLDIKGLRGHKERVVDDLVKGVEKLIRGRKIDLVRGNGRLLSPREVMVEPGGSIRGRKIVIATGSSEMALPGIPFDGESVLSSTDLLELKSVPGSLVIVGGGVIGCEFASIFRAFGTKVTVVEMLPSLVATEDGKVSRFLRSFFRKKGIEVHLKSKVEEIVRSESGIEARLDSGKSIEADTALISVGRVPNTEDIGLEEAGVEWDRHGIKVDNRMETVVKGVYAAGDVTGGWLLAHVATREGTTAAENVMGAGREVDYGAVPSTIYTLPEISRVGLTEEEAKDRGIEYSTGNFPFAANGKAKGLGEPEGFVKWLADKSSRKLIGLHIMGPQATELIAPGVIAVEQGITIEDMEEVIFAHPTLAEALGEAVEDIDSKSIHLL